MCDGAEENVERLFERYFEASWNRADRLAPKGPLGNAWSRGSGPNPAAEPWSNLMEVSGYCLLLAEYYGKPRVSELIKRLWDGQIEKQGNEALPGMLARAATDPSGGGSLGEHGRARVEQLLWKKEGRHASAGRTAEVGTHASPVVRAFVGKRHGRSYGGVDVFLGAYLAQRKSGERHYYGFRGSYVRAVDRELGRATGHERAREGRGYGRKTEGN